LFFALPLASSSIKNLLKKEEEGIRLKFLGFLGDGFGVKEKKKAGTGG
jgi:hypothetical protein